MNDKEIFKTLVKDFKCGVYPCGSRVTCDPPPTDTDEDFLVTVALYCTDEEKINRTKELYKFLEEQGFENQSHEYQKDQEGFNSFVKDELNLIVTDSQKFADNHMLATRLCTKLNLMDKKQRIALFNAILYGRS